MYLCVKLGTYQPNQPKEHNMATQFIPKADDEYAQPLTEYAVVKSSNYLAYVGTGLPSLRYAARVSAAQGGRVIVSRTVGTTDWFVVEQVEAPEEFTVPDSLPEDFKG